MNNSIIIDKILIHMLDMEHSKVIYSDTFINLIEGTTEYYDKKIEKCFSSTAIKELIVGQNHHLITAALKMVKSDEDFKAESIKITQDIFELCRKIEEMPNANLMFVELKLNAKKYILIIKLNYKMMPMSIIEEIDGHQSIRFVNQQILPNKTAAVEEAIIINVEDRLLQVIEKRFTIDGKPGYYLNEQYIKGEPKLTDKQKMSAVNKVVKKVDSKYNLVAGDPMPLVKKELIELVKMNLPVKPLEIAQKIIGNDLDASEEAIATFKDMGIEDDDEIVNVPLSLERMSRCKLVLDDDRVIEMNVEDYLEGIDMKKEIDEHGKATIILSNIEDIIVK